MSLTNRDARLLVSGLRCPHGHEIGTSFSRADLEAVADGTMEFYCIQHDASWPATEKERSNIRRLLTGPDAPI